MYEGTLPTSFDECSQTLGGLKGKGPKAGKDRTPRRQGKNEKIGGGRSSSRSSKTCFMENQSATRGLNGRGGNLGKQNREQRKLDRSCSVQKISGGNSIVKPLSSETQQKNQKQQPLKDISNNKNNSTTNQTLSKHQHQSQPSNIEIIAKKARSKSRATKPTTKPHPVPNPLHQPQNSNFPDQINSSNKENLVIRQKPYNPAPKNFGAPLRNRYTSFGPSSQQEVIELNYESNGDPQGNSTIKIQKSEQILSKKLDQNKPKPFHCGSTSGHNRTGKKKTDPNNSMHPTNRSRVSGRGARGGDFLVGAMDLSRNSSTKSLKGERRSGGRTRGGVKVRSGSKLEAFEIEENFRVGTPGLGCKHSQSLQQGVFGLKAEDLHCEGRD